MPPLSPSLLRGYGLSVLTSAAALAVALAWRPLFELNPFLPSIAAVALSTWYGGRGPGLLALLLSAASLPPLFLAHAPAPLNSPPLLVGRLSSFVLVDLLIIFLITSLRASEQRARALAEAREMAEREAEEATHFRALLEAMPDAILVSDEAGRLVHVNQQAERLFGYARAELLGQSVEALVPERFRRAHARDRQGYLAAPRLRPMGIGLDLVARRRDGSEIPVEISLSPLRTRGGLWVISAVRDVSERRRLEAAERESQARFRAIFEAVPLGIARLDLQGRILEGNGTLLHLLGYDLPTLLSLRLDALIHRQDLRGMISEFRALAAGQRDRFHLEHRCRRRDGAEIWCETLVSLARGSDGEPRFAVALVEDVTERVRQRRRREALLRVSRRLAAEADPLQVLGYLLEEAVAVTAATAGAVYRWDETEALLVPVRSLPPATGASPLPLGEGMVGQAAKQRAPVLVPAARAGDGSPGAGRAGLALPLLDEGRLLGALELHSDDPARWFTTDDLEVLELLAGAAAAALAGIERAQLRGITLAAREMAHLLNNDLTLAVGGVSLLSLDARLPVELQPLLQDAAAGLDRATGHLRELQRVVRLVTRETPVGPALDLARSASAADQRAER